MSASSTSAGIETSGAGAPARPPRRAPFSGSGPVRGRPAAGQRAFELVPNGPGGAPRARVVGPGRLERSYIERLGALERSLERATERGSGLERQLETSHRLERGCQAMIDRLEERAGEDALERRTLEQREKRLILALGGLQRENELLREQLALGAGATLALPPSTENPAGEAPPRPARRSGRAAERGTRRPGWLARLFRPRP